MLMASGKLEAADSARAASVQKISATRADPTSTATGADPTSASIGADPASAATRADPASAATGADPASASNGADTARDVAGAGSVNAESEGRISTSASEAATPSGRVLIPRFRMFCRLQCQMYSHRLHYSSRTCVAKASSRMINVLRRLKKTPKGASKMIMRFRRDKKSGMIVVVMDFGGQKVMHPSYARSVASSLFSQFMITKIARCFNVVTITTPIARHRSSTPCTACC